VTLRGLPHLVSRMSLIHNGRKERNRNPAISCQAQLLSSKSFPSTERHKGKGADEREAGKACVEETKACWRAIATRIVSRSYRLWTNAISFVKTPTRVIPIPHSQELIQRHLICPGDTLVTLQAGFPPLPSLRYPATSNEAQRSSSHGPFTSFCFPSFRRVLCSSKCGLLPSCFVLHGSFLQLESISVPC
jgi:hypothetical protein